MNLALADALASRRTPKYESAGPRSDAAHVASLLSGRRTSVCAIAALHVHPKFNYKMWHVEGWVGLARWLRERGIASVY